MQKNQLNLQDGFLNMVRKESIPVTIYLMGGYQLRGIVKGFDNFTIILDAEGKGEPKHYQTMVYKHAITTISPQRAINFNFNQDNA